MYFKPFDIQKEVLRDKHRIKCLFAAKRSGKSEVAYIESIIKGEKQPGFVFNGRDGYDIGLIAPTDGMLRRLVWPKFRTFAAPFEADFNKTDNIFYWKGKNTRILGFSAEKISRMEGQKLSHVHMTEAFQMGQFAFLEAIARTADTQGTITIDGSLGPNLPNPKAHWLYKTFVENKFPNSRVWEWTTADNPYFPRDELVRLKDALDPRTYRQMFEIDWNVVGTNLVYDDFDQDNIRPHRYDPNLETYVAIDWGWAHAMACIFIQYDRRNDTVYIFDEIVRSKMTLEQLWESIKAKNYRINKWICDIAGNQEREQTGYSNIEWFASPPRNVSFEYRRTAVTYGIPIVRQYIKNGLGQRRLLIDEGKCPKTVDCMKNYAYQEKDGQIVNENPVKKDDDPVDAVRYFFVNMLDPNTPKNTFNEMNRWKF